MQDKTYTMALLYDFFGELLTEKQRDCFNRRYNEDLTLAEIAECEGISRQGVLDLLKRAEQTMLQAEEKTGVVQRFCEMRDTIYKIEAELTELRQLTDGRALELTESVIEKLQDLKE